MITLDKYSNEYIMAVIPKYHSGPGWSNRTITVIIGSPNPNNIRTECIQQTKFTKEMWLLFDIGRSVQQQLKEIIKSKIK